LDPRSNLTMCWRVTRKRIIKGKVNDYIGNMISRYSQSKMWELLKHEIQGLWLSRDLLMLEQIGTRPESHPGMSNSRHKSSQRLNAIWAIHAFAFHYKQ
jgi:hypothetical protein